MFDFSHFLPLNANSAYLAMPNMAAAIDMYVDLRHYANILNKVNLEDREFFTRHFLDSGSDDDEEFYVFEGVNFVLLERIENPPITSTFGLTSSMADPAIVRSCR